MTKKLKRRSPDQVRKTPIPYWCAKDVAVRHLWDLERSLHGSAGGEVSTKSRTNNRRGAIFTQVRAADQRKTLLLLRFIAGVLEPQPQERSQRTVRSESSYACRIGRKISSPVAIALGLLLYALRG